MRLGSHCSEETKLKLSIAHTNPSPETRAKLSLAQRGNTKALGCLRSEGTKVKMSIAQLGKILSTETKAKISAAKMGHTVSPETRAKMSIAGAMRTATPETRAKLSVAKTGHPFWPASPEALAKRSAAQWKGGRPVTVAKMNARRRTFGLIPLNSWFVGCEGHHINNNDVIYMPRKLHRSIYHNQRTGQGMAEMNALAGQYLTEDWT